MKRKDLLSFPIFTSILIFVLLSWSSVYAQRVVNVTPGFATLNNAIFGDTTATGERVDSATVYVLERGGLYLLDATIENRFPLSIVADSSDGARPILQPAVGTGGGTSRPLTPRADITLRGLYITNEDELGALNTRIIRARGDDMRIVIDDCHLDKDGQSGIRIDNPGMKIFITNSIFSNIGLMTSPNNGRGIDDRGNAIDTLVVENNTIYNLTSRFLRDDGGLITYAKVDHNTFYNIGQGTISFGEAVEVICTNNLFINTAFLGTNLQEDAGNGAMRLDSLSQANIDSGFVQSVTISHNNFHLDTNIVAAYPDTILSIAIYDTTAQAFVDASGLAATNVSEPVVFTLAPAVPDTVVTSYYATLTDPTPNPENMDQGNGGAGIGQEQMPFNFNYAAVAAVSEGGTAGEAMGSMQWSAETTVGRFDPLFEQSVKLTAYPNPSAGNTTISYTIDQTSKVQLSIFNMNGQEVSKIVDTRQAAGVYEIQWNANQLPAGIYVYRIQVNENLFTKKLVLTRK